MVKELHNFFLLHYSTQVGHFPQPLKTVISNQNMPNSLHKTTQVLKQYIDLSTSQTVTELKTIYLIKATAHLYKHNAWLVSQLQLHAISSAEHTQLPLKMTISITFFRILGIEEEFLHIWALHGIFFFFS